MQEFYDCVEVQLGKKLMQSMRNLIKQDPSFLDPYLVLADLLLLNKKSDESRRVVEDAYQQALMTITDHKGNWPKSMEWGWLENRHIMRAIERYAYMLWEDGNIDQALELFRKLLKANPRDNQGTRYCILAIRLDLGLNWDEQFMVKDGPMAGQAMEAGPVNDWFELNAKKFSEEFDWLFKKWKEYD